MPLPLAPVPASAPDRARFGLDPDAFTFLFSYDYNSVFKRKNPLGAVAAFKAAFGDDPGVQLVLKCINHDKDEENHDRLRIAIEGAPNIRLIAGYLDVVDKHVLAASCDAFVSLHRSEGFGLGLAEAMMLGKPVVATDYGGSRDFLDEGTGFPVRYGIVPVGDDAWPYPPELTWADPDLDDAARQLRAVVADPTRARALAARGADRLRRMHNPHTAGVRMARRLATIDGRRDAPPPPTAMAGIAAPGDELLARIDRGPVPPPHSPLGGAGRFARKLALRLMKPYTAHARTVQHDLAVGLQEQAEHLRQAVSNAQIEAAMADAAQLAEARRLRTEREAGTTTRIDDLVVQVDELRLQLQVQRGELAAAGFRPSSPGASAGPAAHWPEAPAGEPWDQAYTDAHRDFVARELDDAELIGRFRSGERLPDRLRDRLRRARHRVPVDQRAAPRRRRARRGLRAQPPARADAAAPARGRPAHRHARARAGVVPEPARLLPLRRPARAADRRRPLRPDRLRLDARARRDRHELLRRRDRGRHRRAGRGRPRDAGAQPRPQARR